MSAATTKTTVTTGTPVPYWPAVLVVFCGLVPGAALTRAAYQADALRFTLAGNPATVAGTAILLAAGWVARWVTLSQRWGPARQSRLQHPLAAAHIPLLLPLAALFNPAIDLIGLPALILAGVLGWAALTLAAIPARPGWLNWPGWVPLGISALLLWLYVRTLAPTVGQADTFEFQVNAIRLGVSHGSGYPAYILLARLFSLLPIGGTAAFRVNLSSAVFGALAAVVTYGLARRVNAGRAAGALAALALGTSFGVWSRAIEAEVYTLNTLLVAAILWLLLALPDNLQRWLPWLGLAIGVSAANHLTTGLLAPVVLAGLLLARADVQSGRANAKTWLLSGGLLLAGLGLYLYLPLRWPAINNGEIMTWEMFWRFITGQEAQGALHPLAFIQDFSRYEVVGRKALDQWGRTGIAFSLLGLGWLVRAHRRAALLSVLVYLGYSYFGLSFYVPDPDFSSFLMPAHMVQALWMGLGLQALLDIANRLSGNVPYRPYTYALLISLAVLIPVQGVRNNYTRIDQSNAWDAYRLGQAILREPLAEGATILADSQKMPPLFYLQVAEGVRPDLDIVVLPNEDYYRAELDARIANGQTVYLGRYLPHLGEVYNLRSVGALTEVQTAPQTTLPAGLTALNAEFGPDITLAGLAAISDIVAAGETLPLTLYWQANAAPQSHYLVTFRLLNDSGTIAQSWPGNVPTGQMYPTAAWAAGEVVADYHALSFDRALPPGSYRLQVALLPPFSDSGPGSWADVLATRVQPPSTPPAIAQPLRMRFGPDLWLLGAGLPDSAAPGSPFELRLHWQLAAPLAQPATITLSANNGTLATATLAPDIWPVGTVFTTRTPIDPNAALAQLVIEVSVADKPARCGWLYPQRAGCALPAVTFTGAPLSPNATNFDNKIALNTLAVAAETAQPGDIVIVTAEWVGLQPMSEDYTTFVQFIAPDGRVHGQVDIWPVQGTLPTSTWTPGRVVQDRFEVRLPDNAPHGTYQVQVGWYLLATLARLPVINAEGQIVDDKQLAPAFIVPGP